MKNGHGYFVVKTAFPMAVLAKNFRKDIRNNAFDFTPG